jgi:hypothetical protein
MQFIENGTSGSQNIIISQGSGANITIPPGDVKAVYLDGAGSGAAVVDAFANLKVTDPAQTNITSLGTLSTLTVDDITINGSTISDAGDLAIDVEGDIILDANGGDISLKDDGTHFGNLTQGSNTAFVIKSVTGDSDIFFQGVDGSTPINALQLDMSAAGEAIFNAGIKLSDGNAASFGTGADLLVYHSSNENIIQANTSDQDLLFKGNDGGSSITALTLDMSDDGAAIFKSKITLDGDLDLGTGSDRSIIGPTNSSIIIKANPNASDEGIIFSTDGGTTNEFFIQDGGNIGINQDSPTTKLNIIGAKYVLTDSGKATGGIHIQSTPASSLGEYGGAISFAAGNVGSAAIAAVNDGGSDTDSVGLAFITHGSATSSADAIEVARFDETGNFGIGTNAPASALHISGGDNTAAKLTFTNTANSNTYSIHAQNNAQSLNIQEDGGNVFTITTGGKVGINSATPTDQLEVNGGSAYPNLRFRSSTNTSRYMRIGMLDATEHCIEANGSSAFLTFKTGSAERMRIAANGDLGWSATSAVHDSGAGTIGAFFSQSLYGFAGGTATNTDGLVEFNKTNSVASNNNVLVFSLDGSFQGDIDFNGGVVRYNTTSDYRRKENVTPLENATNQLKQLKTYNFNFIDNPDFTHQGFLAHEAQEVVPNAVSGSKDAVDSDGNPVYQTMDNSVLVPLLVKTIQELEARITTLEGE